MRIQQIVLYLLFAHFTFAQQVIPLYEGKPYGSEDWTWSESVSTKNIFNTEVVYNVVQPTITAYLPPYYLATGTAVIIAPGGAFHTLSINSEGVEVAKWLNSKGIAAFVLKYRVVRSFTDDPVQELMGKMNDFKKLDEENAPIVPLAMADGLAAVKYVRDHAAEMDINPNKIGFMGFSAGGTLTMSVVYNATEENRPNFVAPIYAYEPAIIGSKIPAVQTPIFVAVAGDDQLGMMPMSINIYKKWFDAQQPAELHIYQKGGHGFGMRKQDLPTDTWYERFGEWLHLQGLTKKLYPNKYEKLNGQDAFARGKIARVNQLMKDYADLYRYKAANEMLAPPKLEENRVVFLGNSITDAWPKVDSLFFVKNNYIGRGISAQTSSQLLLRFRQDVLALQPKIVVIHIGTNDVAENTGVYNPEFTVGNIQSMAELAKVNGIKVILASVLPHTKFEWNRALGDRSAMIVDLNQRLKDYANNNHITYVDYHSAMKNEENGMNPDLALDGVHPTPKGYEIMKGMVRGAINKELGKLAPDYIPSGIFRWDSLAVEQKNGRTTRPILNGSTVFLSSFQAQTTTLAAGDAPTKAPIYSDIDQLIIVKEGQLQVTIGKQQKVIGPGSVVLAVANEAYRISNIGDTPATYYLLQYKAKTPPAVKDLEGSLILNVDSLLIKRHDKGARRDYYNRSISQLNYFEMHTTMLLPGVQSHPPHTHHAAEILLITKGNTEHYIDGQLIRGKVGDLIFLESDIPHTVRNVGEEVCEYFAFQWGN